MKSAIDIESGTSPSGEIDEGAKNGIVFKFGAVVKIELQLGFSVKKLIDIMTGA